MPARLADLQGNVNLGIDNTLAANTSANIAIGNMNTTDSWGIAVGSNNTAKNNSIIVGRDNSGNDSHVIVGANNTATTPRYRQAIGTGNFVFGVHNTVDRLLLVELIQLHQKTHISLILLLVILRPLKVMVS